MSEKNPHEGHRERLRAKFRAGSLAGLNEHERLELILFYAVARKDTNVLAHSLIDRFGSLEKVLNAPYDLLASHPGIGPGTATFLRLIREAADECIRYDNVKDEIYDTPYLAAAKLMEMYRHVPKETVCILAMDKNFRLIHAGPVCQGKEDSVSLELRKVTREALSYNSAALIIGHNHPSGLHEPSVADIGANAACERTLAEVGIDLVDHIIISGRQYVSFAERGYIVTHKKPGAPDGRITLNAHYEYLL